MFTDISKNKFICNLTYGHLHKCRHTMNMQHGNCTNVVRIDACCKTHACHVHTAYMHACHTHAACKLQTCLIQARHTHTAHIPYAHCRQAVSTWPLHCVHATLMPHAHPYACPCRVQSRCTHHFTCHTNVTNLSYTHCMCTAYLPLACHK
jgi:hypothetical protein